MAPRLQIDPDILRTRRLGAFLTREELAAKAGISDGTIKAIERGNGSGVRPSTVRKLAEALRCDPQDISQVVEPDAAVEQ